MLLEKIATKEVATVGEGTSLQEAAQMMRESHVGDLVVVAIKNGREIPVGVLTDRDLVMATVALGINPLDMRVEDIMTPSLIVAGVHDSLSKITELMKEHGIKRIPIVDSKGSLSGIISADDIIGVLSAELGALSAIVPKQRRVETERRRKFA